MHERDRSALENALAEVWDSGGRRFVTAEDADDDERFVQYIDGQLNVAWPFDEDPEDLLEDFGVSLPERAWVVSSVPFGTAILAVGDLPRDDVVALIEALFDEVLEAEDVRVRVDADR